MRIDNDPLALAAEIGKAGEQPEVVLEATYGWYWAADVLAEAGARVHLAHPLGVKGFAYRRVKNDERDAADLADLLRMGRLPEAWIAPPAVRELRELVRHRAKLVALRSGLKAQVHAVLAKQGVQVPCRTCSGRVARAELAAAPLDRRLPGPGERLRRLIDAFDFEIDAWPTGWIAARLATDPGYRAIQAIPGVGPVLGRGVRGRDRRRHPLRLAPGTCARWAGLTPRHRESDTTVHRGRITKQGTTLVRWAAVEAVQRIPPRRRARSPPGPQITERRGPQHRQGRRRPQAAHPGLLRAARRPHPRPRNPPSSTETRAA